ncbi:MAG TPA: endonuclease/exonuclease/phosphatase family protein [Dongiaceae bacterium]|nr:endonuclease/exonuclease/phosphatase family protein [Dongiaceae bacterium]
MTNLGGSRGDASPGRRLFGALVYPLKIVIQAGLLGAAVATLAPLLAGATPLLGIFEAFRLQLCVGGALLTVLGLLFRPRAMALLGVLAVAWNLAILWPYLPLGGATPAVAAAPGGLKVVSANLWYRNDSYEPAVSYLMQSDADVIGLVELTPQWLTALQPLFERYPYRADCMQTTPPCEIMLLSRHPFEKSFAGRIDGKRPAIVWGEIEFGGKTVTVAETHLPWPLLHAIDNGQATVAGTLQPEPLIGAEPLMQSQQSAAIAQYLSGLDNDLVLMGDFNSVPWSTTHKALRAATGLHNDGPMVETWPAWGPFWMRLPIDHIFVRGGLERRDFRRGPYIGSDHLPVEAVIVARGATTGDATTGEQ